MATDSEWMGAELIKILSTECKQHVERAGQRGYVDATGEEGPSEEEEAEAPSAVISVAAGPLASIPEDVAIDIGVALAPVIVLPSSRT